MNNCKYCKIEINFETAPKSFVDRGFTICRRCHAQQKTNRLHKLRHEVLTYLGGKCVCCGINDYNYLSIDHINGGGIEDREQHNKWSKYLKSILNISKEEVDKKYQALCYNCNCAKGFHGVCPHKFNYDKVGSLPLTITNRGVKQTHLSEEERYDRHLKAKRVLRVKNRLEMIKAYGGKCVGCGEAGPLFLALDHIHNNGKSDPCGVDFYQYLRRLGYPGNGELLQLLCYNCNSKKEYIDLRCNKDIMVGVYRNEYEKKPYFLSDEDEGKIWLEARTICALIEDLNT